MNQQKDKEEEIIGRRRKEDDKMRQIVKEHKEGMARIQQGIHELEQEERRLKDVKEKERCNARIRRTSVFTKLLGGLRFCQLFNNLFNNYYLENDICKPLCFICTKQI